MYKILFLFILLFIGLNSQAQSINSTNYQQLAQMEAKAIDSLVAPVNLLKKDSVSLVVTGYYREIAALNQQGKSTADRQVALHEIRQQYMLRLKQLFTTIQWSRFIDGLQASRQRDSTISHH